LVAEENGELRSVPGHWIKNVTKERHSYAGWLGVFLWKGGIKFRLPKKGHRRTNHLEKSGAAKRSALSLKRNWVGYEKMIIQRGKTVVAAGKKAIKSPDYCAVKPSQMGKR